jgi:hypothetical protein
MSRHGADGLPSREWQQPSMRERLGALLPPLLIDLVLPYGVFFALTQAGVGAIVALAAGGAIPVVRVLYARLRGKAADPIAIFIVALFAIGIILSVITGDAKFAVAKEGIFTGLVGVWCLVSLFVGRPLMFYVRRQIWPVGEAQWEAMWRGSAPVRRNLYLSTAVWGVGLVIESVAVVAAVYSHPVKQGAAWSLGLNVATITVLVLLTHLFGYRFKKHATEAGRAAGASRTAGPGGGNAAPRKGFAPASGRARTGRGSGR